MYIDEHVQTCVSFKVILITRLQTKKVYIIKESLNVIVGDANEMNYGIMVLLVSFNLKSLRR